MSIKVLLQNQIHGNVKLLDEAWSGRPTFALIPDKSGVSREWIENSLSQLPAELATDHFILLTSGSTGQPKLVVAEKNRAERLTEVIHRAQAAEPATSAIGVLPLTYSYSLINQWLWARHHQRELVLTPGFSEPDTLGQAFGKAENAQLCLVRIHVPLLMSQFKGRVFNGIIRLNFAGGRFPQEDLSALKQTFPQAQIFNNYGCTEAMPRLTIRRAEDSDQAADVGRAIEGVRLAVHDGQLCFQSPYAAKGVIEDGKFHAFKAGDWIETGDLAQIGADGRVIITGRTGEIFKRHGEKISIPLLLDSVATAWKGQSGFYREQDPQGEAGHVLVLAPHPTEDQMRDVLAALRQRHPRSQWPLRLESAETLPLLPNSKVDTAALPKLVEKKIWWYNRFS